MDNSTEIKKNFNLYSEKLKAYQNSLEKDFPKPGELFSYIRALEQYCVGTLGTKTRKETYAATVNSNKKKNGRPSGSAKKTEQQYRDMVKLTHGYIAKGDSAKKACKRAGFKSYENYKVQNRKFNKK